MENKAASPGTVRTLQSGAGDAAPQGASENIFQSRCGGESWTNMTVNGNRVKIAAKRREFHEKFPDIPENFPVFLPPDKYCVPTPEINFAFPDPQP